MVKKFFCSIGRWIKRHKVITVLIVIILIAAVIATFIMAQSQILWDKGFLT